MQSVKHLDSARHFCVVLLYDDWQSGADFTALLDMNVRMSKDSVTDNFELSPYLSFGSPLKTEIKVIAIIYTPDNLYHTDATCCRFWKIHCRITYCIFLCGKRNNNN